MYVRTYTRNSKFEGVNPETTSLQYCPSNDKRVESIRNKFKRTKSISIVTNDKVREEYLLVYA